MSDEAKKSVSKKKSVLPIILESLLVYIFEIGEKGKRWLKSCRINMSFARFFGEEKRTCGKQEEVKHVGLVYICCASKKIHWCKISSFLSIILMGKRTSFTRATLLFFCFSTRITSAVLRYKYKCVLHRAKCNERKGKKLTFD